MAALIVAGCAADGPTSAPSEATRPTAVESQDLTVPPAAGDTAPATVPVPACRPPHPGFPAATEPVPAGLQSSVQERLADPRFAPHLVSVSVWVEGWGEVAAHDPDRALLPASNQKLATAMAALTRLDLTARLRTTVLADGVVTDGRLDGDLIVVAGGDPTLTGSSLSELAQQVRDAGIVTVTGGLIVDESRYESERAARGWLHWQQPRFVGALSAFVVDHNQWSDDAGFLADPALANTERLRQALSGAGVSLAGGVAHGPPTARETIELASIESPSVGELVDRMLVTSDNMIAESLARELGIVGRGEGSTSAGTEVIDETLDSLCGGLFGESHDGAGLSRENRRSAREWRWLLQASQTQSWWPDLVDSLPVAGRTGTMRGRLRGPATVGNVRAKTGSIVPGRALSGTFTTLDGRQAFFSVIVNGEEPDPAESATDALIEAIASHPG